MTPLVLTLAEDEDGWRVTRDGAAVWRRCPRRALRAALDMALGHIAQELAEGREVRVRVERR